MEFFQMGKTYWVSCSVDRFAANGFGPADEGSQRAWSLRSTGPLFDDHPGQPANRFVIYNVNGPEPRTVSEGVGGIILRFRITVINGPVGRLDFFTGLCPAEVTFLYRWPISRTGNFRPFFLWLRSNRLRARSG